MSSLQARLRHQYGDEGNLRARIELHRRFSVAAERWTDWVFARLALAPGEALLEVGCGPGDLWRVTGHRLPAGVSLTLTDSSPGMVERARAALGERADYAVAPADDIPFPDDSFDVVVANHMLYHVPDLRRALAELARVLRPGGRLVASTIGADHLAELGELAGPGLRWMDTTQRFGLENGAGQLAAVFDDVVREDYEGDLVVTEAQPLVAFVASLQGPEGLPEADAERIRAAAQAAIDREGSFRVTRATGLFRARARGREGARVV